MVILGKPLWVSRRSLGYLVPLFFFLLFSLSLASSVCLISWLVVRVGLAGSRLQRPAASFVGLLYVGCPHLSCSLSLSLVLARRLVRFGWLVSASVFGCVCLVGCSRFFFPLSHSRCALGVFPGFLVYIAQIDALKGNETMSTLGHCIERHQC